MKNPNAVVSATIRIESPESQSPEEKLRSKDGLNVVLDEGRRIRLDPQNPLSAGYFRILEGLSKQKMPVYLVIDPLTDGISNLLVPHVTRISGTSTMETGDLRVDIEHSHGVHFLRKDKDFDDLKAQIEEAIRQAKPVILTEDDDHNIIDIRFFIPGVEVPILLPFPRPVIFPRPWWRELLDRIWRWPFWPWWWFGCISQTRAQEVFNAMNATSCDPLTIPVPCIPFLYPDDGCWGRAHEMRRLMVGMGLSPRKVWIMGSLQVSSRNKPNCTVYWGWHVAPTLCVRGPRWYQSQRMVIDPSLFTTPVNEATWKSVQGDPSATLTDTAGSQFSLGGGTDPSYTQTNSVLATYRLRLQARALQMGTPPYANCP